MKSNMIIHSGVLKEHQRAYIAFIDQSVSTNIYLTKEELLQLEGEIYKIKRTIYEKETKE